MHELSVAAFDHRTAISGHVEGSMHARRDGIENVRLNLRVAILGKRLDERAGPLTLRRNPSTVALGAQADTQGQPPVDRPRILHVTGEITRPQLGRIGNVVNVDLEGRAVLEPEPVVAAASRRIGCAVPAVKEVEPEREGVVARK